MIPTPHDTASKDGAKQGSPETAAYERGSGSDTIGFAMEVRRIIFALGISAVLVAGVGAQEPSVALKQADAEYRAGVAALSRDDLKAALANFQNVVKLAPSAEQGHSALGAVLVRLGRLSEGIRELEQALKMKPTDASAPPY